MHLLRPLLVLSIAGCACARSSWICVTSPNFEVLTDAGERTGREAAARFESARRVFFNISKGGFRAPLPVRVFLFASEGEFQTYRNANTVHGFYQSGPDRDYITFHSGPEETWRVALHEYVHLVLNHSAARLPRWLEEGTAELYSTVSESRGRALIGRPIPSHVETLRTSRWLSARDLADVRPDSPYYNEREKAGIFYAESWALVHMLNFSPPWRDSLPRFAEILAGGRDAADAFPEAFGHTLDQAIAGLAAYVSRPFPAVEVEAAPAEPMSLSAAGMSPAAADIALAELLLATGNTRAAEKTYRRLAAQNTRSPEIETGLGALDLRQRRYEEARRHLKRAIDLGSRNAATFFEYAMLLRDSGGDRAEVLENLHSAVTLNPKHPEAHFLLALAASEDGRQLDAVEHLLQAIAVLPRQSYFWHALAMAYHQLGRSDDARRAANRALETASTPHEQEMAEAAVRLAADRIQESGARSQESVVTPKSWENPKGDARAEGTLKQVDCLGGSARLHIVSGRDTLVLWVGNPRQVAAPAFTFQCGPQKPAPVVVEYRTHPDKTRGTIGDLTSIEFR